MAMTSRAPRTFPGRVGRLGEARAGPGALADHDDPPLGVDRAPGDAADLEDPPDDLARDLSVCTAALVALVRNGEKSVRRRSLSPQTVRLLRGFAS
jgi:hypothetical protein